MDIKAYMQDLGIAARESSRVLARAGTAIKNNALLAIATRLDDGRHNLLAANAVDMENGRTNGLDAALLDRLELNDERISGMIEGLKQVAALQDPIGTITDMGFRPSGIQLGKMRVPLGVIGIIYESRPNVTIDAPACALSLAMPLFCAVAVRPFYQSGYCCLYCPGFSRCWLCLKLRFR